MMKDCPVSDQRTQGSVSVELTIPYSLFRNAGIVCGVGNMGKVGVLVIIVSCGGSWRTGTVATSLDIGL